MAIIDVTMKGDVDRTATAEGRLRLKASTIEAMKKGDVKKGDPLKVAEVAALLAVKDTPNRIPYCHPLPISACEIAMKVEKDSVVCACTVKARYRTGVEMEALSGVTAALLTVWDMVKYFEKDEQGQYPETSITDVKVVEKIKGG